MVRHGEAPYLECSSKGDARFSAFHARLRCRGGASIEELYQAAKVINGVSGLSWRQAKGKVPGNPEYCALFYAWLWDMYLWENPHLKAVLLAAPGLSDVFGQPGRQCQATELWRIRNL